MNIFLGIFRYTPSSHLPSINIVRSYSAQINLEELTVDYDYVKQATANNSTLIIDVREPREIVEHGKIPNSVNIPCKLLFSSEC